MVSQVEVSVSKNGRTTLLDICCSETPSARLAHPPPALLADLLGWERRRIYRVVDGLIAEGLKAEGLVAEVEKWLARHFIDPRPLLREKGLL